MKQETAPQWATWLQAQLDVRGWRQADLVRESQGLIKRDRVSKWLRGAERPTHRMAVITANTLGVSRDEVLGAAGYEAEGEPVTYSTLPSGGQLTAQTPPRELALALAAVSDVALLELLLERAQTRDGQRLPLPPEVPEVHPAAAPPVYEAVSEFMDEAGRADFDPFTRTSRSHLQAEDLARDTPDSERF
ncbi:hypothetical protein [Microbacterium rhizophilus]|uniref:hypothetical protein n=1 Tax=Microbacterium rhizophilus TaxID=3138934 RepID=UPI0031ED3279